MYENKDVLFSLDLLSCAPGLSKGIPFASRSVQNTTDTSQTAPVIDLSEILFSRDPILKSVETNTSSTGLTVCMNIHTHYVCALWVDCVILYYL